jgi:CheY-like chemotaxis protein
MPDEQSRAQSDPQRTAHSADAGRSRLRILVVDDLVDAAESLALLLRTIGDYEVRTAYDGPTGLQAAEEMQPDAIFLDIALPRLSGYRVAERLRSNPLVQQACLIALTGLGRSSDIEDARQAGFDRHLLKPIELKQLEDVLAEVQSRVNARASTRP